MQWKDFRSTCFLFGTSPFSRQFIAMVLTSSSLPFEHCLQPKPKNQRQILHYSTCDASQNGIAFLIGSSEFMQTDATYRNSSHLSDSLLARFPFRATFCRYANRHCAVLCRVHKVDLEGSERFWIVTPEKIEDTYETDNRLAVASRVASNLWVPCASDELPKKRVLLPGSPDNPFESRTQRRRYLNCVRCTARNLSCHHCEVEWPNWTTDRTQRKSTFIVRSEIKIGAATSSLQLPEA